MRSVKGANQKHHQVLEDDDVIHIARVRTSREENPRELFGLCPGGSKKAATIEAGILEKFRNCLYFSLALDTAQFGQDHFISCVSRFGFDDRISQEIIIFEKVSETTGQYLARFVFENLRKNATFQN